MGRGEGEGLTDCKFFPDNPCFGWVRTQGFFLLRFGLRDGRLHHYTTTSEHWVWGKLHFVSSDTSLSQTEETFHTQEEHVFWMVWPLKQENSLQILSCVL